MVGFVWAVTSECEKVESAHPIMGVIRFLKFTGKRATVELYEH